MIRAGTWLVPCAWTGDGLVDLQPYVAAVDGEAVVFQATRRDGGTGLYRGEPLIAGGTHVTTLIERSPAFPWDVVSHPAVDGLGGASVYVRSVRDPGQTALVRVDARRRSGDGGAEAQVLLVSGRDVAEVGPLGPTAGRNGAVAMRATLTSGRAAVLLVRGGARPAAAEVLATVKPPGCFEGLPCVDGVVAWRVTDEDGSERVERWADGVTDGVTSTSAPRDGDDLVSIGRFPSLAPDGAVIFMAVDRRRGAGIYRAGWGRGGALERLVGAEDGFESLRTALWAGDRLLFYGTPPGGSMGLYTLAPVPGPGARSAPSAERVLGFGDAYAGSTVTDLAVNPASVDHRGWFAARFTLADGRQGVLRGEPVG